ncbi:hypothetical protein [Variovorax sp. JS1663]|uniref:hypothetical protein n=1 Tax=Variovorax sp. JS1663 TaxID=1851577 RepID=UPI000B347CD4|nr:hypothetical protein [Variovorax sp. JS1663]OUM00583.1 hypothetical protein A8M77_19985 [Variovorax sp. JS1663]
MTSTAIGTASSSGEIAFGNLIDLAMLRTGAVSAEVCEACSTINLGSARLCKGCSHKLPAYYAGEPNDTVPTKAGARPVVHGWARVWDLMAFWLVINSLAGVTVLVPVLS